MANISISGGTSPTVAVYGKNLGLTAGLGTDSVGSTSVATTVSVGNLNALTVNDSLNTGALGNDTINLGSGVDTIVQSGQATVTSAFSNSALGNASVVGGELGTTLTNAGLDVSGVLGGAKLDIATVMGGALDTANVTLSNAQIDITGTGNATLQTAGATLQNTGTSVNGVFTGLKADLHALAGTAGVDSLTGGGQSLNFMNSDAAGLNASSNFVSPAQLHVDGYSLSYLQANHDISSQGGNTYISIDGGKTSIELKGIGGLTSSESSIHKT